jgi:4-hydroxy-2-oxoheptanedioate aldolase
MTFVNPLAKMLREGKQAVGGWATLPSSLLVEIAGRQKLDYVCIDLQHGLIDDSSSIDMLQALSVTSAIPIVRVRWNEPPAIMSALDAGALGVIVPMIETAEDARQAVRACRYPPHGQRSYGPIRARDIIGSTDPRDLEQVMCIVMIETEQAIANLDEIMKVPGVDALYIGPSDLGLALGETPGKQSEDFYTLVEDIRTRATAQGLPIGIHTAHGEVAKKHLAEGFNFVTLYSDAGLFQWAINQHQSMLTDTTLAAAPSGY